MKNNKDQSYPLSGFGPSSRVQTRIRPLDRMVIDAELEILGISESEYLRRLIEADLRDVSEIII